MVSSRIKFLIAIGVYIILSASAASADIYRYRDENGVWHFTNIKSDKRYKLYIKTKIYVKTNNESPAAFISVHGTAINQASERFGVESSLIKAVIRAESAGDEKATSSKGAQGLMQLMPDTADDMAVEDRYNPEDNIFGGTRYLSMMLERFNNNTQFALAAYNAGPESVAAYNGVPPFQETKTFIKRVMTYYNQYKSEAQQ